jgi:hypothetical protein
MKDWRKSWTPWLLVGTVFGVEYDLALEAAI